MTSPIYGSTQQLAATTTSAALTLNAANKTALRLQITNAGAALAFVRLHDVASNGASAATVADFPIIVSTSGPTFLETAKDCDTLYAITATGSATLHITAVEGGF